MLDVYFLNGAKLTLENIDRCVCGDSRITCIDFDGRVVLQVQLCEISYFEVKIGTA